MPTSSCCRFLHGLGGLVSTGEAAYDINVYLVLTRECQFLISGSTAAFCRPGQSPCGLLVMPRVPVSLVQSLVIAVAAGGCACVCAYVCMCACAHVCVIGTMNFINSPTYG